MASDFLLASESCEALIIWPQRLLRLRLYTSFSSSVSPYLDVTVEPEVVFKEMCVHKKMMQCLMGVFYIMYRYFHFLMHEISR